jgi:hypothetical protein
MRKQWIVSLFLFSVITLAAWAQLDTAQLTGTVTDKSGAVIPDATVSAKNIATALTRSTRTNQSGSYTISFLPPGKYSVKAESKGFATVVQNDVVLLVGMAPTLNFSLSPGSATETLEVTAEAPLIETTRSDIGSSVSPIEVKELPIVDRNFSGLMSLVPGVRPSQPFDPTKTRSGNVSINGNDGRAVEYTVDAGNNKDNVIGGLVQNFTMEGIQEFKVDTARYNAETAHTVGGAVNVVSKSGTNTLHGTAFSLFQNSTLNKNDFFSLQNCQQQGIPSDKCPKPVFHRYHFGGSIGGPIKKNKLFFFGAYEHKREPGSISVLGNAFQELSLFPLAQPVSQLPFPYTDHLVTVKVDHHLTDKQNMFYRYGRERWVNPNDQLGNPFFADLSQTNSDTNQFHDFVIQHNYALAPNKVNSLNLHYQYFKNEILPAPTHTFTLPVAGGGVATNPEICFKPAPGCGSGDPEIGQNVNVPQQTLITKLEVRNDFSYVHGRHNMKFGGDWIHLAKLGGFFFFGANGYQVIFWDDPSVILANKALYPQGFATPGAVQELIFSGGSGSTDQRPRPDIFGFYYQDDFKATKRLTLNLGVRWDANYRFLPRMLGNSLTNTNRTIAILQQVVAANPTAPGTQQGLARALQFVGNTELLRRTTASWKEFQPRVGFAWDPTGSGKMVIRGGYGIARDQIFQNLTLFALQQTQPTIYQTIIDLADTGRPGSCAGQPLCGFRFGIDPLPAPAPGIVQIANGATGRINDPHMTDPWAQQTSIGWAWQFSPTASISADYYHILGTHEPRVLNINPVIGAVCDASFPGANPADPRCVNGAGTRLMDAAFAASGLGIGRLSQIYDYATNGRSQYDALNVQIQKRMSRHFTGQASYVLSRSASWGGLPSASYRGSNATAITPEVEFLPNEFGLTPMDERHRFTLSGVVQLPGGFELAPLVQVASARPFEFRAGSDLNGDGRSNLDRVCVGSTLTNPITTPGCTQVKVNTLRGRPLFQVDLRTGKTFKFGERAALNLYWEFFNLFNRQNFCGDFQQNSSASDFAKPIGYCGLPVGAFGPAPTGPFRSQYGFRFEF